MEQLNDDNCKRCPCGLYVVARMVEADFLDNQKIPTFLCSCGEVFYNQTQSDLIDYIRRLKQKKNDTELQNLRELIFNHELQEPPNKRSYAGDWTEVVIGVGKDNVVYITLPNESLAELLKLTVVPDVC